jgi:DNA-binding MarR family transcriptional regulator
MLVRMPSEPFDDPRLTAMGLLFETVHGVGHRCGDVFRVPGISGSDFDVLIRLARSPYHSLRLTDLASQTSMSTSGITRVIDRLERAGLAERVACATDRRSFLVGLTDEGGRRLTKLVPDLTASVDRWFTSALSPEELDGLLTGLRKVRDHVHPGATAGAHDGCPADEPLL